MSFQQAIKRFAPGYMSGGRWMGTLLESVGMTLDELAERTFLGRCAALPYAAGAKTAGGMLLQCEPDVLPWHARDRGITLYPTEPLASKRFRLSRWRQADARRGTHRGEMENVQPYFLGEDGFGILPRIRIVHQDGDGDGAMWHTLSGSADPGGAGVYSIHRAVPSNWNYDGQTAKWSRRYAIVYLSGTVLDPSRYDDGSAYDDGSVYDGILTAVAVDLVAMLRDRDSAHSRLSAVILATDPASFDPAGTPTQDANGWWTLPNGNWGSPIDNNGVFTRLPSGLWIYEQ